MTCSVCTSRMTHAAWCPAKAVALTASAPFIPAWVRRNIRKDVPRAGSTTLLGVAR